MLRTHRAEPVTRTEGQGIQYFLWQSRLITVSCATVILILSSLLSNSFQGDSSFQVLQPKFCMHFSCQACVLHTSSISSKSEALCNISSGKCLVTTCLTINLEDHLLSAICGWLLKIFVGVLCMWRLCPFVRHPKPRTRNDVMTSDALNKLVFV